MLQICLKPVSIFLHTQSKNVASFLEKERMKFMEALLAYHAFHVDSLTTYYF